MVKFISLNPSPKAGKKYRVVLLNDEGRERTIDFGAKTYEDYTMIQDEPKEKRENRRYVYLSRHRPREDWTITGVYTPGFWARWILWNKPTIRGSLSDVRKQFGF
jgi:hypothetical protein